MGIKNNQLWKINCRLDGSIILPYQEKANQTTLQRLMDVVDQNNFTQVDIKEGASQIPQTVPLTEELKGCDKLGRISGHESSVIRSILDACMEISNFLRHSPIVKLETVNLFGDTQLHQDVKCDEIIQNHLKLNPLVIGYASEQKPVYTPCRNQEEPSEDTIRYIVTFDPLDGSSIVDTNFAIGSIFSIWRYTNNRLIGTTIGEQVNAVISIFGPRTTAVYYDAMEDKVLEVTAVDSRWIISHDRLNISKDRMSNIFSPGNLRSASDNKIYQNAIVKYIEDGYTLRYTGGLVVDVYQILIKGHGIFINCGSKKHPCKLRAMYEAASIGFLIEKAGGVAITAGGKPLSTYTFRGYDDRLSFAMGSKMEVEKIAYLFE